MGKRREAQERNKDRAQAEGVRLELARTFDAAEDLHLLPERIPSRYTRKGAAVHRAIRLLAKAATS